jgi:hypothetical protein
MSGNDKADPTEDGTDAAGFWSWYDDRAKARRWQHPQTLSQASEITTAQVRGKCWPTARSSVGISNASAARTHIPVRLQPGEDGGKSVGDLQE